MAFNAVENGSEKLDRRLISSSSRLFPSYLILFLRGEYWKLELPFEWRSYRSASSNGSPQSTVFF